MKHPTLLKSIKKEVMKIHGITEETDTIKTGVILLSSVNVGPNIKKIAKFTGYKRSEIAKRSKNLRENSVWVKDKVSCDWFEKDGSLAFILDCMVADGTLQRA